MLYQSVLQLQLNPEPNIPGIIGHPFRENNSRIIGCLQAYLEDNINNQWN